MRILKSAFCLEKDCECNGLVFMVKNDLNFHLQWVVLFWIWIGSCCQ